MGKRKNVFIFILLIISIALLYIFANKTYTSYESKTMGNADLNIAEWQIKIDDQEIVKSTQEIKLSDIVWNNDHTSSGKVSPGSKGSAKIKIDPSMTQVAIKYSISYVDHSNDPNIVLTVNSISLEDDELKREEDGSYSGIITLDEIKNGVKKILNLDVEWINDENNNEFDSAIGLEDATPQYLTLILKAEQYKGE